MLKKKKIEKKNDWNKLIFFFFKLLEKDFEMINENYV